MDETIAGTQKKFICLLPDNQIKEQAFSESAFLSYFYFLKSVKHRILYYWIQAQLGHI